MSVLDSEAPSPTARCSWLRSSTAPRESMPDSISGASASTELPAVRVAISNTDASEMAHDSAAHCGPNALKDVLTAAGLMSVRKAGAGPSPNARRH